MNKVTTLTHALLLSTSFSFIGLAEIHASSEELKTENTTVKKIYKDNFEKLKADFNDEKSNLKMELGKLNDFLEENGLYKENKDGGNYFDSLLNKLYEKTSSWSQANEFLNYINDSDGYDNPKVKEIFETLIADQKKNISVIIDKKYKKYNSTSFSEKEIKEIIERKLSYSEIQELVKKYKNLKGGKKEIYTLFGKRPDLNESTFPTSEIYKSLEGVLVDMVENYVKTISKDTKNEKLLNDSLLKIKLMNRLFSDIYSFYMAKSNILFDLSKDSYGEIFNKYIYKKQIKVDTDILIKEYERIINENKINSDDDKSSKKQKEKNIYNAKQEIKKIETDADKKIQEINNSLNIYTNEKLEILNNFSNVLSSMTREKGSYSFYKVWKNKRPSEPYSEISKHINLSNNTWENDLYVAQNYIINAIKDMMKENNYTDEQFNTIKKLISFNYGVDESIKKQNPKGKKKKYTIITEKIFKTEHNNKKKNEGSVGNIMDKLLSEKQNLEKKNNKLKQELEEKNKKDYSILYKKITLDKETEQLNIKEKNLLIERKKTLDELKEKEKKLLIKEENDLKKIEKIKTLKEQINKKLIAERKKAAKLQAKNNKTTQEMNQLKESLKKIDDKEKEIKNREEELKKNEENLKITLSKIIESSKKIQESKKLQEKNFNKEKTKLELKNQKLLEELENKKMENKKLKKEIKEKNSIQGLKNYLKKKKRK